MEKCIENIGVRGSNRKLARASLPNHTISCKADKGPRVRSHLAALFLAYPNTTTSASESFPIEPLTAREAEILTWTARGKTRKEIADLVCLSEETVKDYHRKISSKLNAVNKAHAVSIACTLGLISPYTIEGTRCFEQTRTPRQRV